MSADTVERFLMEEMGYKRIEQLLGGQKAKNVRIKEFLDGTIFATFSSFHVHSEETGRTLMPQILKIRKREELTRVNDPAFSLRYYPHVQTTVVTFPYFVRSFHFFRQHSSEELDEYLHELKARLFPGAEISTNFPQKEYVSFHGMVFDRDFYFGLTCPPGGGTRRMDMYFAASRSLVDRVNRIQSKYYGMLSRDEGLNYEEREVYTEIPQQDLTTLIGNVPDSELMSVASSVERFQYAPASSYMRGQVIDHSRFGLGIIQDADERNISVYFPEIAQSKTLIHNYGK